MVYPPSNHGLSFSPCSVPPAAEQDDISDVTGGGGGGGPRGPRALHVLQPRTSIGQQQPQQGEAGGGGQMWDAALGSQLDMSQQVVCPQVFRGCWNSRKLGRFRIGGGRGAVSGVSLLVW